MKLIRRKYISISEVISLSYIVFGRLGGKSLLRKFVNHGQKRLITLKPGANVIKLFLLRTEKVL